MKIFTTIADLEQANLKEGQLVVTLENSSGNQNSIAYFRIYDSSTTGGYTLANGNKAIYQEISPVQTGGVQVTPVSLSLGQTVVTTPNAVQGSRFEVVGTGTDNGLLLETDDYTVTGDSEITLTRSYPDGTKLVQIVGTDVTGIDLPVVYQSIVQAKQAQLTAGTLVRVPSRGNAEYIVEPSSYVPISDGYGDHTMDDGNVLRLVHNGEVNVEWFGADQTSTPAQRTTTLVRILDAGLSARVSAGEYAPIVIDQDDARIIVDKGAFFKLPDNTTTALTVEPVRVFEVSGDRVKVVGDLVLEGNLANNPSDNIDTSDRRGSLHIAGDGFSVTGSIEIYNAAWVGISLGSEADKATNVKVDAVRVVNPYGYATSFWSVDTAIIDTLFVSSGVDSTDARVRTGSQTSSVYRCANLTINTILSNDSVVVEARTENLQIGNVKCDGLKVEDADRVSIGSVLAKETQGAAFSFAILTSTRVTVGTVNVDSSYGTAGKVVAISGAVDCKIGVVIVSNTKTDITDFEIRTAQGLEIGTAILRSPDGAGRGFLFDYDAGYAPQEDIYIGTIISTGHAGLDVEVQSPELADIHIGQINQSATTNVDYLKNKNIYTEGTSILTVTPDVGTVALSGSNNEVAWCQNGSSVTVTGRLKVSSVNGATGGLTLSGLPFAAADLPDVGGSVQFYVNARNTTGSWTGSIVGETTEGASTLYLYGFDGGSSFGVAELLQVNTTLGIQFTYRV